MCPIWIKEDEIDNNEWTRNWIEVSNPFGECKFSWLYLSAAGMMRR